MHELPRLHSNLQPNLSWPPPNTRLPWFTSTSFPCLSTFKVLRIPLPHLSFFQFNPSNPSFVEHLTTMQKAWARSVTPNSYLWALCTQQRTLYGALLLHVGSLYYVRRSSNLLRSEWLPLCQHHFLPRFWIGVDSWTGYCRTSLGEHGEKPKGWNQQILPVALQHACNAISFFF